MTNTDAGRDLLCINKNFPVITQIGKNFVRSEYEPGKYITDFRVGAKWANVIRYRWTEFVELMRYAPGLEYTLHLQGVPVAKAGVYGTTTTVYPDPDPETTTVDGHVGDNTSSSWDTTHDASGNDANSTLALIRIETGKDTGGAFRIRRGICLFDTSAIDAGDTVSSATMSLYGDSVQNDDNDGDDFLAIVTSNPASNTDLATGDYDAVGDTVDNPTEMHDAGARIDLGSISTVAYNDFSFNSNRD